MQNSKFVPSVRYINDIQIYFCEKTVVQVAQRGVVIDIVRWDKPGGGTYAKAWRPFCVKLCRRNNIENVYQIMALAAKYSLMVIKCRHPRQPPPGIWVRPSRYIWL